jgi:hypothetical protein
LFTSPALQHDFMVPVSCAGFDSMQIQGMCVLPLRPRSVAPAGVAAAALDRFVASGFSGFHFRSVPNASLLLVAWQIGGCRAFGQGNNRAQALPRRRRSVHPLPPRSTSLHHSISADFIRFDVALQARERC